MIVNVLWAAPERMSYSCCHMLNSMFDRYTVKHHVFGDEPPEDGAVIVFHGGNNAHELFADQLNQIADQLNWVIFISVGDENTDFPYLRLAHKKKRLWVQTPKPGKVTANRYFIEGYPHDCRELLDKAGDVPRTLDWMFAGQVNHVRRERMAEILRAYPYGLRALLETKSFGAGLSHEEYYKLMKSAWVVPCPSGPATPDSFRFAEALEAGCMPVLDACAPDGVAGYWDMVLGEHPFQVIEEWEFFPMVVKKLMQTRKWSLRTQNAWWRNYKNNFNTWLAKDLLTLGAI